MSTRALRKLQNDNDLGLAKVAGVKNGDDTAEENDCETSDHTNEALRPSFSKVSTNKAAPKNIFTLLNDESEEENEEKDEEVVKEQETEISVGAKMKKKKKKKNKNKSKESSAMNLNKEKDEIEAIIQELDQNPDQNAVRTQNGGFLGDSQSRKLVLSIDHRNLNPENEIRRIFGSKVVEQERTHKRQRGHHTAKLVQPKANWDRIVRTGLLMRLVETKNELQYFAFEHNKNYQKIQFEFLDAVESLNPQNIVNIVNMYPFHIDALIQISEVYKMSDDAQQAAETIERVLYVFEQSFHPVFSLTQGTSRLDYRRNENRSFYLALFHHLMSVGRRGCWRTALEFCKLLLSFDPDNDPLCVLLMIDFYAIRSEQYSFLVRLFQEWESHRNLSLLPNFAFSVPLAMYHLSLSDKSKLGQADEMLQKSLIMFPGVLFPLLDKCSVAPDSAVQKHGYFTSTAQSSQTTELQQLIQLYVGRSNSCWKEPGVMLWLETNVKRVLDRVNAKDPLVDQCLTKRSTMYRGTPRNICRHVILSEIKEAMSCLPPEIRLSPILSYDPLPPLDAISSYERPPRPARTQQMGSPFSAFFRSILPTYDPQEPAAEPAEGAVGGRPEGAAAFRQGIGALVDAMRELLDGIQFVPHPVENGAQQNEGGDGGNEENEEDPQDHDSEDEWN